jgi:peptidoglycan/xylan/chitin deacetylase (PgdA/CDA1 family)
MNLSNKIKYGIKFTFASLLYYSGLLFLIKAVKLKNKAIVLMYHRVLDDEEKKKTFSHSGIVVDKRVFAKQMHCLKKSFHVMPEEEFLTHLTKRIPFRKNSCLITFDDGWLDNYTNAYPILKKSGLPASIFLSTGYIGTGSQFWQEKLAAKLFSLYQKKDQESMTLLKKHELDCLVHLSPDDARRKIRDFVTKLKKLQSPDLHKVLIDYGVDHDQGSPDPDDIDVFLNWDQVREMARNNISFGSHSVSHHILTKISLEEARKEIDFSRQSIIEHTGKTPKTFCYPNGDYTNEIAESVSDAGYLAAFSTINGHIAGTGKLYALPRINIHNDATNSIPLFMARILGLF